MKLSFVMLRFTKMSGFSGSSEKHRRVSGLVAKRSDIAASEQVTCWNDDVWMSAEATNVVPSGVACSAPYK